MQIIKDVIVIINAVFEIIFPNSCSACGKSLKNTENIICIDCLRGLPFTNYHLRKNNEIAKIFYGSVDIKFASSFLLFHKNGIAQKLIHRLKYKGDQEVGDLLARLYFRELSKFSHLSFDFVIPVPLHKSKEKIRGYNQLDSFGKVFANEFKCQFRRDNLIKISANNSQTKKGIEDRWENVKGVFTVLNPLEFEGKHILLIDDVLTTGSTLKSCLLELDKIKGVELSVITMAHGEV